MTGCEEVAGIQADRRARMPADGVEVRADLGYRGAQHGALASHWLQQQVRIAGTDAVQHGKQALAGPAERRVPVSAGSRAGVHDEPGRADLSCPAKRVGDRLGGSFPELGMRGGNVDQVGGMREDWHPSPHGALAEQAHLGRILSRPRPGARISHEDLDYLGTDGLGVAHRSGTQAFRGPRMCADRPGRGCAGMITFGWGCRRGWHGAQRSGHAGRRRAVSGDPGGPPGRRPSRSATYLSGGLASGEAGAVSAPHPH